MAFWKFSCGILSGGSYYSSNTLQTKLNILHINKEANRIEFLCVTVYWLAGELCNWCLFSSEINHVVKLENQWCSSHLNIYSNTLSTQSSPSEVENLNWAFIYSLNTDLFGKLLQNIPVDIWLHCVNCSQWLQH